MTTTTGNSAPPLTSSSPKSPCQLISGRKYSTSLYTVSKNSFSLFFSPIHGERGSSSRSWMKVSQVKGLLVE
jgi:hypothetical protein